MNLYINTLSLGGKIMGKKIFFSLIVASAACLPFMSGGEIVAKENDPLARLNININTGFYPYCNPYCTPYFFYYPYPYPPCAYPCPPPYWMW
jgi:hypothetical protein